MEKVYNVLVLCKGNSARSIMAEGLINVMGHGRFKAYSAGSHPVGQVNPLAIEQLQSIGYETEHLRSKSWDEFTGANAPHLDFVITVCDDTAGESCPTWFGAPVSTHWGFHDPCTPETQELRRAAFGKVFREIMNRVHLFVNLPMGMLDMAAIHHELLQLSNLHVETLEDVHERWVRIT